MIKPERKKNGGTMMVWTWNFYSIKCL